MPFTIEADPLQPTPKKSRHLFRWILLAALLALVFSLRSLLSFWVDLLWYSSLGYSRVFWTSRSLQWSIFAGVAVVTFIALYGVLRILLHAHRDDLPPAHVIYFNGQPVSLSVRPVLSVVGLLASALLSLASAGAMASAWPTFALYLHAPQTSGVLDPIFQLPLGFYLFTLPAWNLVAGWLLTLSVLMLIASVFFVVVSGGTRMVAERAVGVQVSWRGVSLSAAFLFAVLSLREWLSRFAMLTEHRTIFDGVNYTDAHVDLFGKSLIAALLALAALIALVNAFRKPRLSVVIASILPAVVGTVLIGICGWYVSSFIVKPNEMMREQPYIANNIAATRTAWGLDHFDFKEFPAETSVEATDPEHNQATLSNIRLWDPEALKATLRQLQEMRTYYDFPDIDIDRYTIDGQLREVMLSARELNVEKLPSSSRNWINEKLIYTHGYGITMNPVNGFTAEGMPSLVLSNMPVQSTTNSVKLTRPEIYYGEMTDTDIYVKTRQLEFNYPQGDSNNMTSYEGSGGIELGGLLRRILLAFDRGDLTKVPFSDDISDKSRLLMRRNIRARVAEIAPFLTVDQDPYLVVGEDGRLTWLMDGFTTSNSYPYSTHYRVNDQQINTMRNSVKIAVDAYDGSVKFYVFDASDPILSAWRGIFPDLFRDASQMPACLRQHTRYPELLLRLQAEVYGLYHMTNPSVFYNREDLWTVATENTLGSNGEQVQQPMEPNFVLMKLPGEQQVEFVEILPFTPANRNNLIGWIAARSDGAHYGSAVVYNFPKTRLVDGPQQIEARIDQNAQLSGQLTLWNQQGSHVRRGSLLVIPSGKALLYAEPIYLQADRSPMPELRLVVLALQDRLAYGPNFEAALSALFGGSVSSVSGADVPHAAEPQPGTAQPGAAHPADVTTPALIHQAGAAFNDYQRLTAAGKLGEAGKKLDELKQLLDQLNARSR